MTRRTLRIIVASALAAGAAVILAAAPPAGGKRAAPAPYHPDAIEARQATLDATAALLDENEDALRDALRRLKASCRQPARDEVPALPHPIVNYSRGFHLALDRTREVAAADDQDQALVEFRWVLLGCRDCHAIARRNGVEVNLPRR